MDCVVNLLGAAVHRNTLESPEDVKKQTGKSKTRLLQEAFVDHLGQLAGAGRWR
jgi:hypothetical protein